MGKGVAFLETLSKNNENQTRYFFAETGGEPDFRARSFMEFPLGGG
jgi:hypothetical protein